MGTLEECLRIYGELLNKDFILTLENGIELRISFQISYFKHLIGLHKLEKDMVAFSIPSQALYKKILAGEITQKHIEKSAFYSKIQNRLSYFDMLPELLRKSKIIIDFDPSLVKHCDLRNTKYILYKKLGSAYINLTLGYRRNQLYPETFLYEESKRYINGQTLLDIVDVQVINREKRIEK